MNRFLILIFLSALAFNSFADCNFGGVKYKTGQEVAGFICTKSGKWIRK